MQNFARKNFTTDQNCKIFQLQNFLGPLPSLIPHSLYPPEETELCLFSRADKKTTKQLLEEKKVQAVKKVHLKKNVYEYAPVNY